MKARQECTCEFELSANFARAHALERSIRSRKNGNASLGDKQRICYGIAPNKLKSLLNRIKTQQFTNFKPVSSLSKK